MLVLDTLRPSKLRKWISHYPFRSALCITTAHLCCSWSIFPTVVHRHQHGHFSSPPSSSSVSKGWAVRSCQESGAQIIYDCVSEDVNFVGSLVASSFALRRLSFSGCCLSSFPHICSNCSCTENTLTGLSHDIQMTDAG